MMDCDTTGIEPDLALVKYKRLVGGGLIKIVNNTVPQALMKLGYTPEQSSEIVSYIDKNGKIEGARDRKSTRLNSSHTVISYAVFCLKTKIKTTRTDRGWSGTS